MVICKMYRRWYREECGCVVGMESGVDDEYDLGILEMCEKDVKEYNESMKEWMESEYYKEMYGESDE